MLQEFDDAIRAAAEKVANVDRDVRRKLVRVTSREERYSEKFVTLLDERLNGFAEGGLEWRVSTHIADKQSGEERDTGSDLFISLTMDIKGMLVQKGIQAQAKVNKNKRFGLSVDSPDRLKRQCTSMLKNSDSSFVFAYGEQTTKVLTAQSVLDAGPNSLTHLTTQGIEEVFYDFFVCRVGDRKLFAEDDASLQTVVSNLRSRSGVLIETKEPLRRARQPKIKNGQP